MSDTADPAFPGPVPDLERVRVPEVAGEMVEPRWEHGGRILLLGDTVLRSGDRIALHRRGAWHGAEVVEDEQGQHTVVVQSNAWPEAPVALPRDALELIFAKWWNE